MHGGSYIPGGDQSTHYGPVVPPEMHGGNYIPGSGRPTQFEPVVSPVVTIAYLYRQLGVY